MTNDTLKAELLFDPSVPDEETELGALAASLRLTEGFALIFARCNQPEQRRRLIKSLREHQPQLKIQEIEFREPILYLLDELRDRIEETAPDAIFVSGLEYSFPVATQAASAPLTATLNISRDAFGRYLPCSLVLWVPEYVLTAIMNGAPDFFSVRSGVYFFALPKQTTLNEAHALAFDTSWQMTKLSYDDRTERMIALRNLLQEYQSLPFDQRALEVEARLTHNLAGLYLASGLYKEAEKLLGDSLLVWQQLGNRAVEAIVLCNIGAVLEAQGLLSQAQECYEHSLLLDQGSHDPLGMAKTLGNLGNVYLRQGELSKAEEMYRRALDIYIYAGNLEGEGLALSYLGLWFRQQGQFEEAEQMLNQSLIIKQQLGDKIGKAYILNNLGIVYGDQGRVLEGENSTAKSLSIFQEFHLCVEEGRALDNLAVLKAQQNNLVEAINLSSQAVDLLNNTEAELDLKRAQEHIKAWRQRSAEI